jgi:hypothetical protein
VTVIPLDPRRRLANVSGAESCPTCGDEGLCTVGTETRRGLGGSSFEVDVVGPCPRCERGFAVEFGVGAQDVGPWGRQGFWRGRAIPAELLGAVA